ncbi:MAG: FMN-binding protein [Proteobacteria bacterium]|nr:FMN-binding protein [Pseudomonadota bacterium]
MNVRFLLLSAAAVALVTPAYATVYLSVEQAQAIMFPGARLAPDFRKLTDAQVSVIEKASDATVLSKDLKAWRTSNGGWFIADEVVGKHEFIPFAVGIDANGAIKDIEILEYRETYGGEVMNPKWRAQFNGKTSVAKLRLTDDIQNISGATLSSKHITDGVRRLMATYAIVLSSH